MTKPFLRWAGGKQWLVSKLKTYITVHFSNYYEPFLGGGSLFFSLEPQNAILSDINPQLIETYQSMQENPNLVINVLEKWPNNEETYYSIRDRYFPEKFERAAQFIYLNKTCWNGLYRVNKDGNFNVPFSDNGREIYSWNHLQKISSILSKAKIECNDFQETISLAKENDFIYLDPPYTVTHSKNGFLQYNEKLFSWDDQLRLADIANKLQEQGCYIMISNANHQSIKNLYKNFEIVEISRHSILSGNPNYRKVVTEIIIISKNLINI